MCAADTNSTQQCRRGELDTQRGQRTNDTHRQAKEHLTRTEALALPEKELLVEATDCRHVEARLVSCSTAAAAAKIVGLVSALSQQVLLPRPCDRVDATRVDLEDYVDATRALACGGRVMHGKPARRVLVSVRPPPRPLHLFLFPPT